MTVMREALAAGRAAVEGNTKGTCSVCGREVALRKDGMPARKHNRTIEHASPDPTARAAGSATDVATVECRGSRRPPVEYAVAFNAARRK